MEYVNSQWDFQNINSIASYWVTLLRVTPNVTNPIY